MGWCDEAVFGLWGGLFVVDGGGVVVAVACRRFVGWSGPVGACLVSPPTFGRVSVSTGLGSGECGDGPVGGDDLCGGGPSVEDAHDVTTGGGDDAGGGVPERPAEPSGFGFGE